MIMCVLLCYPLSIHVSQLLSTGRPISSWNSGLVQRYFTIALNQSHSLTQLSYVRMENNN